MNSIVLPIICKRCGQGPDVHFEKSKYTDESFFICAECLAMWRSLELAILGGDSGFVNHHEYLKFVGRPDHYLDDPNYENWTDEEWDKYNEPWINLDDEFNAQQKSTS